MTAPSRIALLSTGVLLGASAFAHHGFGTFDLEREIELSGTLTKLDWVNPHAWLHLDVAMSDGEVASYRCEMRAVTVLRRSGWTPEMFPIGERVTVRGAPDRRDGRACYMTTIEFADGSTVDRYGQRTAPQPVEALAERRARLADGTPNISGDWAPEQYVLSDPQGREGRLVPLSTITESATSDRRAQDDSGPWATAAVQRTALGEEAAAGFDLRSSDNPRMRCEITSIIFDWAFDGPVNRITQHDDRVVLEYGRHGLVRTIHLGLDTHPEALAPSRAGHSLGRWEGDTLIVDTVGFAAGMIAPPVFHGDKLRVTERFFVDSASGTLTREYAATDPDYFIDAYRGTDVLQIADAPFAVDECQELGFVEDARPSGASAEEVGEAGTQAQPPSAASPWWRFWD